jgi:uncharacterized SAM-binding protein YcdF (DUF218 family)
MSQELIWLLKPLILPPGILLLLALFGFFLGRRWYGRTLLFLSLCALLLLSTPYVARSLNNGLIEYPPLNEDRLAAAQAQAIVVLGGGLYPEGVEYGGDTVRGEMLERLRYAAWLSRKTGLPVIPTGAGEPGGAAEGVVARAVLEEEFGVPVAGVEDRALTTWENATYTRALLEPMGLTRVLLVTHARHMGRAQEIFRQAGVESYPAPTIFPRADAPLRLLDLLPDAEALAESRNALHERIGRIWYRIRAALGSALG